MKSKTLTTAAVRAAPQAPSGAGTPSSTMTVTPPAHVTLRFQLAPGDDPDLVLTAPHDMPWRIDEDPSSAPVDGTAALSLVGELAAGDPIEFPIPIAFFLRGQPTLHLVWGTRSDGTPIFAEYILQWAEVHHATVGSLLVTLGYATGYLGGLPVGDCFSQATPVSPEEQQAVLAFQADEGLVQHGELDLDTILALHHRAGWF